MLLLLTAALSCSPLQHASPPSFSQAFHDYCELIDLPFDSELSPRHYLRGYRAWKRTADYASYVEDRHATLKSRLITNACQNAEERKALEDEVAELATWIVEKAPALEQERARDAEEVNALARASLAADNEREAAVAREAADAAANEDAEQLIRFNYALLLRDRAALSETDWNEFKHWLHYSLGMAQNKVESDEQWEGIKTRLNSSNGYQAYDEWLASSKVAKDALTVAAIRKILEPIESSIRSQGGRVRFERFPLWQPCVCVSFPAGRRGERRLHTHVALWVREKRAINAPPSGSRSQPQPL